MKRTENYCAAASSSLLEVSTLAEASEVVVSAGVGATSGATGTAAAATDAAAAETDEAAAAAMDATAALALAVVARAALRADVALCWELVLPFLRPGLFGGSKKPGANIVFRRGRLGSRVGYSLPSTNSRGRLSRPVHDVLVPLRGCDGVKDLMLRLQLTTYDMSAGDLGRKGREKVAGERAERVPLQTVSTVRTL
jgi:hypothetical protein